MVKIISELFKKKNTVNGAAQPTTEESVASSVENPKSPIKVLLVDDEKESYLLIKMLLTGPKSAGDFILDWASNFEDAKEALLKDQYHVCLVDYYLGEKTGVELIEEVMEEGCKNPMILLTSGASTSVEKNAIKIGAADYIVKGQITPDSLLRSILYTIDRKALEAELAELKERERSPNGILILDVNGIIQYVNNSAETFLGSSASELMGKAFTKTYSKTRTHEMEILNQEKNLGTGEATVTPIVYREQPAQLISIVDITEHKKLRDQLKATNDLLEKSNQSLEQFAHIASHDFLGPLGNLKKLLNMFDHSGNKPNHNQQVLSGITLGLGQMERSFLGLLDTLKVHYGYKEQKLEINIPQMYLEVEGAMTKMIHSSNAVIHTNFREEKIVYTPAHFKSVLQNLMNNAVKFSSSERKPIIFLETRLVDGSVELIVKDNGLGIDLVRHGGDIFGSFKRFHNHVEGTGIGLHNTKSIIESHGGKIAVASKPNVGTTFTIRF